MIDKVNSFIEYVEIPDYFNINLIEVILLKSFMSQARINGNKIDMESLRKFYSKDRLLGEELIWELKLRGFKFVFETQTNFITNIDFDGLSEIQLIVTKENTNKFEKINREIFYNFNFNEIKSDLYFNLIPIYTFQKESLLVQKEFLRYGFDIIPISEVETYFTLKNSDKIKEGKSGTSNQVITEERGVLEKELKSKDYHKANSSIKSITDKLIENIKSQSNQNINIISNFLVENNFIYTSQLDNFNYNNLLILEEISTLDVNEFKNKVEAYNLKVK